MTTDIKYAIQMKNITKIFNGNIIANKNLNLFVRQGDIHALVGENGAGKSTLMNILFGLFQPTSGQIKINGKTAIITNPLKATKLKIGMVHQHFKLVEINKVWENIALGSEEVIGKFFLNTKKIKAKITAIMEKYGLYVDLDAKIENISVGMQQRVEILKLLYRDAEILVFDEPTAVLTPQQIESLLEIMQNLQKAGKTIILITHKMDEIKKVANHATVIRMGENIADFDIKDLKENELAEAMVGRKLVAVKNNYLPFDQNNVVLNVSNLTVKKASNKNLNAVENFNLKVHAGEITAIAGVEGNGQKELIEAITGLTKAVTGSVIYKDCDILNSSIHQRYELGMSHIPEDRHKYGMILDFSVANNIVMEQIGDRPFSRFGFINKMKVEKYSQDIIEDFDIRGARGGATLARGLSGGNQQKAVIGRELRKNHDLLIVVQPTRGLDIGAIEYIHAQLLKEKEKGTAVLLVSYELDEVMALADMIAVINEGKLIDTIPGQGASKETIGRLMATTKLGEDN